MTFKDVHNLIEIVFLSALVFFALLDTILIALVKARKPLLDNKYFNFHRQYGFIKVTLLKLGITLYIVYAFLSSTLHSGKLAAPILAYVFFVMKLLFDYLRESGNKREDSIEWGG
jgi:hypothetical protein